MTASWKEQVGIRILLLGCLSILTFGCAEIAPPSGGPVDTSGPRGISAFPADGSVNYSASGECTFEFSEYVDERSLAASLIVIPRPITPPKIISHGRRVVVRLADSLIPATTYLVSFSAGLKDLRGNALTQPVVIRFSTGATIDTGSIVGRVRLHGGQIAGAVVAAFRYTNDHLVGDTLRAVYRTLSTSTGEFQLDVLPPGDYAVVAFIDADHNERADQDREQIGIADHIVHIGHDEPTPRLDIWMADRGAALSPIARQTGNGLIEILGLYSQSDSLSIRLLIRDTIHSPIAIQRNSVEGKITAWFGSADTGQSEIILGDAHDTISLPVSLKTIIDTRAPELTIASPSTGWGTTAPTQLTIIADEPMDTTHSETLRGAGGDSLRMITLNWINSFTLQAKLTDSLFPTRWYWRNPRPQDLARNYLRDSALIVPYRIVQEDSLGTVAGVVGNQAQGTYWLTAQNLRFSEQVTLSLSTPRFSLRLPAGFYTVESFVDGQKTFDGRWTPGSLHPFRLSEARHTYRDTLAVRARFDISGISLHPDLEKPSVMIPPDSAKKKP